MSALLKQKKVWIPAVIAVLVGLYALAGFVWAPKLLRTQLLDGIHRTLGLNASVGEIRINPFLLQVEVKDFALPAESGAKLLGFERLFVDFEVSSLWHRAFVFRDIDIAAPYAYVVIAPDGRLNFDALKPKAAATAAPPPVPPSPSKQAEPLPSIEIAAFNVSRGLASYEDQSRADHFAARLDPISFELRQFTTGAEGGRFKFTGLSKLGERLQWQGHLSLQPLNADGEFQIVGLHAQTLWNYIKDQVGFVVNSGSIDLNGEYKFALRDRPELHVKLPQIALKDLGIRPDASTADWVSVPSLVVAATDFDLGKRAVSIDSVTLDGVKLDTWLERDGTFNLLRLAQSPKRSEAGSPASPSVGAGDRGPPDRGPPASAIAPSSQAAEGPAASPWQFTLRQLALNRATIQMEDRGTTPAAKFLLAPLNVKVSGISLDLSKPLDVALDTGVNVGGRFAAAGSLTPTPFSTDLKVDVSALGLAAIQPYISQRTSMTLLDGRLNVGGNVHFAAVESAGKGSPGAKAGARGKSGAAAGRAGAAKPALQFVGDVSVDQLHTIDNGLKKDFISWKRLQIQKIDFRHDPDRLDIDKITANRLYARVLIEPDRSLNVARILAGPKGLPPAPTGATAETAPDQVAAQAQAGPSVVPTDVPKPGATETPAAPSKATAPSKPAAPVMPINIRKIVLQASDANFTDLSVKPNFSAGIQALEGSVTGLSSKPDSRAKVELRGQVDRFSPVSIQGELNVLSATLYTDIAMSFRNMELTTFNPYSGKFAGYNISKGKLTTELVYKVDGRKLNAGHHIIIDQLEFGEKTGSKDAVSLPIKLAVALLKDRHGVIDLDFPVTGSLDDPHFRLGPVIWKVVVNLLVKIVTSPFALIGSLFGGGPDMQFVDFPAGVAMLDAAGQAKVKTIVKALGERPQLKISVPLAPVSDLDRPAMGEARLREAVEAQQHGKSSHKKGGEADAPPPLESLPVATQVELLAAVYKKELGGAPKFPAAATAEASAPAPAPAPAPASAPASPAEAKAQVAAAKLAYLREELLKKFIASDEEVRALAQQRAEVIQQVLLTDTQIDPARVFLVANGKAKAQAQAVRLELTLE